MHLGIKKVFVGYLQGNERKKIKTKTGLKKIRNRDTLIL